MGKRINYEQVKKYIESEGYVLKSTNYINAKTKLKIECKEGHKFEMNWNSFQQGKRCPQCAINRNILLRKKTTEIFKKEVNDLYPNDEYVILGEYVRSDVKIEVRHNICGFEYEVQPNNILQGQKCPKCSGRGNFRTTKSVKKEVKEITNNEYEFLGEYTKMIDKTLFLHKTCNNKFEMALNNFINMEQRCPMCFGTPLKTHKIFKKEVFDLVGDEYEIVSQYSNAKNKIKLKHNKCNYVWNVLPNAFLRGQRCPKCNGGVMDKDTKYFKQEIYELYGEEFEILGEYNGANEKILIKHKLCDKVYYGKPSHLLSGHKCAYCNGNAKKTTDEFKEEVYQLTGEEYEVLGEYNGAKEKLLMKHNVCNHEYLVTPTTFLGGCRCPQCNETKGERTIKEWLILNNIPFDKQFYFSDLLGDYTYLKFDFVIFKDVNKTKIECLIEYDGEFHYYPIMGQESLEKQQRYDRYKNEYCKQNNIPLLRIPYWEFDNINTILHEYIKQIK